MDRKDFAHRFPHLVAGLSHDDVGALAGATVARSLVPGDVLIQEGQPSRSTWLVAEGHLGLTLSVRGDRIALGRIGPGSLVGEVSFVDGGPASATLTAQDAVLALEIPASVLDDLVGSHPAAAGAVQRAICEALARHLQEATDELLALGPPDASPTHGEGLLQALRGLFGIGRT